MASVYSLKFESSRVALDQPIIISSADDFSIKFKFPPVGNTSYYRPFGSAIAAFKSRALFFSNGRTRLTAENNSNFEWLLTYDLSTVDTFEFRRVGGVLDLVLDGVVQPGSHTNNVAALNIGTIGANASTGYTEPANLFWFEFEINGVLVNKFNASLSNGTGSILEDELTANFGTLVDFPVDNSQWVYEGEEGPVDPPLLSKVSNTVNTITTILEKIPKNVSVVSSFLNKVSDIRSTSTEIFSRIKTTVVTRSSTRNTAKAQKVFVSDILIKITKYVPLLVAIESVVSNIVKKSINIRVQIKENKKTQIQTTTNIRKTSKSIYSVSLDVLNSTYSSYNLVTRNRVKTFNSSASKTSILQKVPRWYNLYTGVIENVTIIKNIDTGIFDSIPNDIVTNKISINFHSEPVNLVWYAEPLTIFRNK